MFDACDEASVDRATDGNMKKSLWTQG
ncbi:hypothetical protein TPHV1_100021 [Treponema phagedenis]|uniref:Uncharacterized protein n=1 Tax=Treponema phagedenis TaxID=162 RepID=A0A0B7GVJ2_TREPH|nr:hypothetical protein TPHV1_100021 [Treponema phagedenis]